MDSEKDLYLRGFHRSLFYRYSCYECKYANDTRVSDITMADFWGAERLYPNENPHKGVSALLTNTLKGQWLMEDMEGYARLVEVDRNYVISNNSQLKEPTRLHSKRGKFFKVLKETKRFDKAVNSCIPFMQIIAARVLNEKSKAFIIKLMKKELLSK